MNNDVLKFRRFSSVFMESLALPRQLLGEVGVSLTEANILYLLGNETILSARDICAKLLLDAGYVSRIVKGFEKRELVHKRASGTDRRSHDLVLTLKGRKLFEHMKAREEQEVARRLAGISGHKRQQMLRAMQVIERAFEAPHLMAGVQLRAPHPGDISWVVHRQAVLYWQEYQWDQRFEALLAHIADEFVVKFKPEKERAWIAELGGEIVGSMFLIEQEPGVAQLRMLYVEPHVRGMGVGKKLLEKSIAFAREKQYCTVRLWTNDVLHTARGMYERAGFAMIEAMPNNEFGKGLTAQVWEVKL